MHMDEEKREIAVCIPTKDSHLVKKNGWIVYNINLLINLLLCKYFCSTYCFRCG